MNTALIDLLKDTVKEPGHLNIEKMKGLVEETMRFFNDLQVKFDSKDPKKREEALQAASDLKLALEEQMDSLTARTGLDLARLAADFSLYTPEEKEAVEDMRAKLQIFKSPNKPSPKKRAGKLKLIG